jgi:ankyrin repeat protein
VEVKVQDSRYGTALQTTVLETHADIVQVLLENGADSNIQKEEGQIALYIAASSGEIQLIELLLDYDTEGDIRDRSGKAAFDIIRRWDIVPGM